MEWTKDINPRLLPGSKGIATTTPAQKVNFYGRRCLVAIDPSGCLWFGRV
jgi:hypothetical protein